MKTHDEILDYLVSSILGISLGTIDASEITPNARILDDLGLDSLDYATVLLACEKWLGINVREDGVNWSLLSTVDRLASFLESEQKP